MIILLSLKRWSCYRDVHDTTNAKNSIILSDLEKFCLWNVGARIPSLDQSNTYFNAKLCNCFGLIDRERENRMFCFCFVVFCLEYIATCMIPTGLQVLYNDQDIFHRSCTSMRISMIVSRAEKKSYLTPWHGLIAVFFLIF